MDDREIWKLLNPKEIIEKEKRFEKELMYIEIAQFLRAKGYQFNIDDNGLWFEEYCSDHKWKQIFELMNAWRDECENAPNWSREDSFID